MYFCHMVLMRRLFAFTLIVLISKTGVVLAQNNTDNAGTKAWTLEACIERALQKNLNVIDQEIGILRAENALNQDRLDRYPTLNASASHNYNFGRTIDPFTNQFVNQSIQSNNFSLTSGVTIYNGKRIANTIARSENEVQRSRFQSDVTRNSIGLSVADAFLQIIFAKQQLQNFEEINKATKTQLEQAKSRYEAGVVNQRQYINLKAQDARDMMNIQSAKGSLELAYVRLKQLLLLEPNENIEIELPEVGVPALDKEWIVAAVVQNAMELMPDMKLAESQKRSADLTQEISKSGLYPRLTAFANVNTLYSESRVERFNEQSFTQQIGYIASNPNEAVVSDFTRYDTRVTAFGQQLKDNFGQAAGLSVSVPIFNNNQTRAAIEDAKLASLQATNNIERTRQSIQSSVVQAYTDFLNARSNYLAALENQKAQKENYDFVLKSSEAGVATVADMVLALNDYNVAKNDLLRAEYQYIYADVILSFYNTGSIEL